MPIGGRQWASNQGPSLAEKIALLKRQAEESGRNPDSISISTFGARPDPDLMARLEDAGVERVVFALPSADREAILPILDQFARFL